MTDNATSVSVIINAPVDRVWPLLLETHQDFDRQRYLQSDPEGELVEGQVIHTKTKYVRLTFSISRIVQMEPPLMGRTVYVRVSFMGREGPGIVSWTHDHERHQTQSQYELKHPWCTIKGYTNISCITIEDQSCVVVYIEKFEMLPRFLPRWLTKKINDDGGKMSAKAIEAALQKIKIRAEQSLD